MSAEAWIAFGSFSLLNVGTVAFFLGGLRSDVRALLDRVREDEAYAVEQDSRIFKLAQDVAALKTEKVAA